MTSDWMTTEEAGRELGITRAMVRKLLGTGALLSAGKAGRSHLVDRSSVLRYKNRRPRTGRSWAEKTSWAALSLISGGTADWLDAAEKYRLKRRLSTMSATELTAAVSTKDRTERYRIATSGVERIKPHLLGTGAAALNDPQVARHFKLAGGGGTVEGYIEAGEASRLIDAYSMVPDPGGNVVLHIVKLTVPFKAGKTPTVAVAVDLMNSLATRERNAGEQVLTKTFENWKGQNFDRA
ncbi:DNA-binding protein [Arthrobacter livingstonensis]|uniref:DNA-binding protein n=1 Tax=Arthrobacter livingstonensis TaxID=670078 RepID=A0A2V5KZX0_9MICC|nr:helix-turn-helix domain-containing protein [Arthrobacter livingstonensis]PYI64379.1 DNA-binding protein [Arthrobacter livingstonensis]